MHSPSAKPLLLTTVDDTVATHPPRPCATRLRPRISRPCEQLIEDATFEQIVWARLDAMEEVLLQLHHRMDGMATATTRGSRCCCACTGGCGSRLSVGAERLADTDDGTVSALSEDDEGASAQAASNAHRTYRKHLDSCHNATREDPYAAATPTTPPAGVRCAVTTDCESTSTSLHRAIGPQDQIRVDIKAVSDSLAAARSFLAPRRR